MQTGSLLDAYTSFKFMTKASIITCPEFGELVSPPGGFDQESEDSCVDQSLVARLSKCVPTPVAFGFEIRRFHKS